MARGEDAGWRGGVGVGAAYFDGDGGTSGAGFDGVGWGLLVNMFCF